MISDSILLIILRNGHYQDQSLSLQILHHFEPEMLKILYPELYIDHSTKKTTVLRQACDDLAVDCKRYTVLKCHVANYHRYCQPGSRDPYI